PILRDRFELSFDGSSYLGECGSARSAAGYVHRSAVGARPVAIRAPAARTAASASAMTTTPNSSPVPMMSPWRATSTPAATAGPLMRRGEGHDAAHGALEAGAEAHTGDGSTGEKHRDCVVRQRPHGDADARS